MIVSSVYSNSCEPQRQALNPVKHLWDAMVWESHIQYLQQLCDAIILIWTKISEAFSIYATKD